MAQEPKPVRLLRTSEWVVHYFDCPAGSELHARGVSLRGHIVEVPSDPAERAAFKERWDYHPATPSDADKVLITTIVPILRSGSRGRNKEKNGSWSAEFDADTSIVYAAHPLHYAELQNSVYQDTTTDSSYWCVAPRESMLLWDRKALNLRTFGYRVLPVRPAARHRIVLCEGRLLVDGFEYNGPAVIPVTGGERVEALSDVYAAEVWV